MDPGLGGVVIAGGRGTGKSVLARGLHALLPPIDVLALGEACRRLNVDPQRPDDWDATIRSRLTSWALIPAEPTPRRCCPPR